MTNKNQSVKMRRLISLISILLVMVLLAACSRGELPKDNTGIENSSSENSSDENNSAGEDTGSASNGTEEATDEDYFQDLLTKSYWYYRALGCTFEKPEDISLEHYFYTGLAVADRQDPATFTDEEKAFLNSAVGNRYGEESWGAAIKLPAEKIREAFSIFKVTNVIVIPKSWVYYEKADAYYMFKTDAFGVVGAKVTQVVREADKTVRVYWETDQMHMNTATGEIFRDGVKMVMTLQENADGTYLILSNVPADK